MRDKLNTLALLMGLYGRDQGDEPAGMFQKGDLPEMLPGSMTTTIDGQDVNEIWVEMKTRLAAFNRIADQKFAMLAFPVVTPTMKVGVPRNPGFQDATEFGRPTKIRVEMVSRGFPLAHKDLGYGYTQEYLDSTNGSEIVATQAEILGAWSALRRNVVLEALFTEANTTQEAISVKRLYNADGEIPPVYKRWTHANTHTHYLEDASATVTAAILQEMQLHLVHHGFGDFGERLFLHANVTEMEDIRGITGYVPAASSNIPTIVDGQIIGVTPAGGNGGLAAQGYFERWTIIEDNDIPPGYLMGYASGGLFASRNPVGWREHENPSARGLRLVEGPNGRYPLIDAVYDGYVGAGVRQRGAAVLMMINSGDYVSPSFDGIVW